MLGELFHHVLSEALNEAALRTGEELGHELRNFLRVSRGEVSWDELSHVQKTMFLGGNRAEYERICERLRRSRTNRSPSTRTGTSSDKPVSDINYEQLPQPFFDYEEL